ncbi:MAG: hypothetical protein J7M13_08235 [Synergistetes bacterium]|nr:hypothetical protein [Synergistota bacterium]
MIIQFTLTVSEGKRIIAEGIALHPDVKRALREARIVLKGGTTVSAIAEKLAGVKLEICGRITPLGTKVSRKGRTKAPHTIMIENGKVIGIDEELCSIVNNLGPKDVFIVSPNIVDMDGNAAIMAGSPFGGEPGKIFGGLSAEGVKVILPANIDKFSPGSVREAVQAAGRKKVDRALGMAVGLIPLHGEVFTELDAIELLVGIRPVIIGRSGIFGAEGATVFFLEGSREACEQLFDLVKRLKGAGVSGDPESLEECSPGSPGCSFLSLWRVCSGPWDFQRSEL